jgi:leader peptidase (prepilin peptidase)/N-methyltransferase
VSSFFIGLYIKENSRSGAKSNLWHIIGAIFMVLIICFRLYDLYRWNYYFLVSFLSILFLLTCSIKDIKDKEIPETYTGVTALFGVLLIYFNPNVTLLESVIGMGLGGFMLVISYVTRQAVGQGDGLVIGVLGLLLGWQMALAIVLYGLIFSGFYGGYLMIIVRKSRKTKIPFMPFLYGAALVIYLV